MKKLISLILLLTLLCSLTASAEAPVYTHNMQAQKIAIAALKVKYGLTTDMIGLFYPEITVTENATWVAFYPSTILPAGRIGVYEVIINDQGVVVQWTHDDQDPHFWQSRDLFSEYWGAWHLQLCLDVQGIWNFFEEENREFHVPVGLLDKVEFTLGNRKELDLTMRASKAAKLADAAIADMYGLTVYEVEAMDHDHEMDVLLLADGTKLWRVMVSSASRCFSVYINDATGEIFDIIFSTGGNG